MTETRISKTAIFKYFLWLGSACFGGPLAIIGTMERELCHERKWVKESDFEEAFVFCKLLPGPVAYQMGLWIGRDLGGIWGGLLAGIGLLLPSGLLMVAIGAFYHFLPGSKFYEALIDGMRCGALIIILDSIWRLAKPLYSRSVTWIYLPLGIILFLLFPRWEPVIIFSGGLASWLLKRMKTGLAAISCPILFQLFWIHFKAGLVVFGTGLAVLPVLQAEIVDKFHWLTNQEFLDGIAFGQVTPGPVTITSVFVGYRVAEIWGALSAFFGMYLPGVIFVLFLVPIVKNYVRRGLEAFQYGALPTVIGCLLGATIILLRETATEPSSIILLVVLGLVLLKWHPPTWALLPGGSVLSFIVHAVLQK